MRRALVLVGLISGCEGSLFGPGGPASGPPERPDVTVIEVAPAPTQVRVLSAPEYRRTVRDLLGLATSDTLSHADWTGGFDTGAATTIDDNLLGALVTEGERLAQDYVATRLGADFACFDASISDACVQEVISKLGRRAWRRPLGAAERDELFAFFGEVAGLTDRRTALETTVARLVTAPRFLYRTEVGTPRGNDEFELDAFERAALVSYTLTGSMPDEGLLSDAEAGVLDDARLRQHIRRLWSSPSARERQTDFFRQWLKVTTLDQMARRPGDFAKLTSPALGASLKAEFDQYVISTLTEGPGTVPALLTGGSTFVDAHTAPLYGLTSPSGTPQRVALPSERRGVLMLASTLAAIASASDADRDRPVLRGLMVKRQLLCEDIGPPSNLNTVVAGQTANSVPNFAQLTTREQYEVMMEQGAECSACHRQFMPLGFTFGRFDALGRYREAQRGRPVVTTVADVPVHGAPMSFDGPLGLVDALAADPDTAACFTRKLVGFTLGAPQLPYVETLGASLTQQLGERSDVIALVVEELLLSPHVRHRKGVAAVVPPAPAAGMPDAGAPDAGADAGTPDAGTPLATTVLLASGASLRPNERVVSVDGAFTLLNQLDGNVVLYETGGGPRWASGTAGSSPGTTSMQGDGNFVVYDAAGQPRFNTGTHGNPGAVLRVDRLGRLSVVATDGRVLWTSTGGMP